MDNCISRNNIIQFIEDGLNRKEFGHDAIEILAEVQFAPTVDVAPVVHGHWENVCHYPYPDTIRCSVCGREFNGNEDWKGCPVCLARMDGE